MPHLPDFEAWAIFAKVAEKGSFSHAAEELGLAKTTVSKTVTRLEERMRTTLLHRTTRKLSLTETGRLSLERAMRILADGAAIEADILEEAAVPRGSIRLASMSGFGTDALAGALPEFLRAYPEVRVDLTLRESHVDLVGEGFDAAIQVGAGVDSSLRTSRLFSFRRPLLGAPALLEARGMPAHPSELARYPAVIPTHVSWGQDWVFEREGHEAVALRMDGCYRVNNPIAMIPALVAGIGLAILPEFYVWKQLEEGSLVELLPDWRPPSGPVFLVTPPGRARPARVRVLLEFLREHFARQPWAHGIES
ncbi:DNA-binding transcriptional LysR family regulator [Novosphingobium sp. PhB165]|uniref:LysR family transcriptional regulator n=1 Tax=Novosphingobium sp. PhB165 TaxID=2485105 RepID=UPI0010444C19|nr:LysR family transcriptional regulator [Novosphingobium sp. PhB165]TCM20847.1 DNA-binding transcriptional LysR family regulator [Novosphingobium sp. PhB165]